MRAGVVLCIGVGLWASGAAADTYYRYRDSRSGRDVFVNSLDQVPRRFRDNAKIVLETDDSKAPAAPPAEILEIPPETDRPTLRTIEPASSQVRPSRAAKLPIDLRQAFSGKTPWRDGPVRIADALDSSLTSSGAPPLTVAERRDLGRLLLVFIVAAVLASLAFLAAWLIVIIVAVRDGHPWWGVLIFLFWPLATLYLFLHVERGRKLFKGLCTVGLLAPMLVGVVGAWRLVAWFQALTQARGGHL